MSHQRHSAAQMRPWSIPSVPASAPSSKSPLALHPCTPPCWLVSLSCTSRCIVPCLVLRLLEMPAGVALPIRGATPSVSMTIHAPCLQGRTALTSPATPIVAAAAALGRQRRKPLSRCAWACKAFVRQPPMRPCSCCQARDIDNNPISKCRPL